MFGQEISNQPDVLGTQLPSLDDHDARHGSHGITCLRSSPAIILFFFSFFVVPVGRWDAILRLLVASWWCHLSSYDKSIKSLYHTRVGSGKRGALPPHRIVTSPHAPLRTGHVSFQTIRLKPA
jgi:hypothetical protein